MEANTFEDPRHVKTWIRMRINNEQNDDWAQRVSEVQKPHIMSCNFRRSWDEML